MYRPPDAIMHERPHTNLKRSSSLEDLTTESDQFTDVISEEPEEMPAWRLGRMGRVRTCNESFRAAVDRSYDPIEPVVMDTCKML